MIQLHRTPLERTSSQIPGRIAGQTNSKPYTISAAERAVVERGRHDSTLPSQAPSAATTSKPSRERARSQRVASTRPPRRRETLGRRETPNATPSPRHSHRHGPSLTGAASSPPLSKQTHGLRRQHHHNLALFTARIPNTPKKISPRVSHTHHGRSSRSPCRPARPGAPGAACPAR